MSSQPDDVPNVSMANTKKELLDAYEEAKNRLQNMDKDLLNADKARKQLENKLADTTAESQASQDPLKRLHDLRGAISREMTDLAERFETEIETYRKVQSAVASKQEELKTMYEVETAASDLAALIDAQRLKKEQFEQEIEAKKATFEEEMADSRSLWTREKDRQDRQAQEEIDAIKIERQRERENYEYSFLREKEQRTNDLEDQLRDIEKEIALKQKDFEQEHRERESDLNAREAVLTESEKEIVALQKEVETFPNRLDKAIQKAVENTTHSLTLDFKKDKALLESGFEGEKNVLAGKIESLEKMVTLQAARIDDLSKSQENAYEKVQDIANRAVSAAKREVYLEPLRSSSAPSARDANQTD